MPNRYICTVFDEMRDCLKTNNFSYLGGLINEANIMAQRMEAKLYTIKDFERLENRVKEMRADLKKANKDEYGD